jgi:hypothetical protein
LSSGAGIVVEHSTRVLKIYGSNPAADTGRQNMTGKTFFGNLEVLQHLVYQFVLMSFVKFVITGVKSFKEKLKTLSHTEILEKINYLFVS